jgi:hypothetical protein
LNPLPFGTPLQDSVVDLATRLPAGRLTVVVLFPAGTRELFLLQNV